MKKLATGLMAGVLALACMAGAYVWLPVRSCPPAVSAPQVSAPVHVKPIRKIKPVAAKPRKVAIKQKQKRAATKLKTKITKPRKDKNCDRVRAAVAQYGMAMVKMGAAQRGYSEQQITAFARKCGIS